ncbi:MAG: glycoside hydrolase family 20 zincin-like fold domain-containing protein, partial [Bacteroidales bacterium]|nr:glycoside hydrolase family 20 zincin-like fold domain-containing protein [Bacteroidales bacterium]
MILSFLLAALLTVAPVSQPPRYDIVPTPRSLTPAEGSFVINKTSRLLVEAPEFKEIAEDFTSTVKASTGFALDGKGSGIVLRKIEGLGKEAYKLSVSPSEVLVEASDVPGAFYGLQTFLQ